MKVSASIEFVMQLAGQEAIAREYEKITPYLTVLPKPGRRSWLSTIFRRPKK